MQVAPGEEPRLEDQDSEDGVVDDAIVQEVVVKAQVAVRRVDANVDSRRFSAGSTNRRSLACAWLRTPRPIRAA